MGNEKNGKRTTITVKNGKGKVKVAMIKNGKSMKGISSELPKESVHQLVKSKDLSVLMGNIIPDVKKTRKNRK